MEAIDAKMLSLKEQGAAARGYKGQLTKVVKRIEKAKEQLNVASFQEAQACNDNLNRQLESYNKALDKVESCIADMSVTLELGISLANDIGKEDTRQNYLESLNKYSGYITKSEEEIEGTSDNVEKLQKHAIEVLGTREEEKEKALEEKLEEKFRTNESFKKSVLDRSSVEPGRRGAVREESK